MFPINIDQDLPASGILTDQEIFDSIKQKDKIDEESESDLESEATEEIPKISSKEALEKTNDLKSFFLAENVGCSTYIDFLFSMENYLLEKTCVKQSKINEYFKN
ncbi:unnamed protein product [Brachionus calyciflorus]|uniref:Uncharacterized protein n=1 Tax=Brachionus calyciflorus TaxID=104777 RepID=A0A814QSD6_9BILA|nr:unnamed protein product [Brachionus calyciflorus]